MQLNEIHFAGFVGKDAETRSTQGGESVTSFSLCHSRALKSGKDESTWVQVTVFGAWTETAKNIKKGDNVLVNGMLKVETYKDKDGIDRTSVKIIARSLGLMVKERRSQPEDQFAPMKAPANDQTFGDEIPF